MKRYLSVLLFVAIVISIFPIATFATFDRGISHLEDIQVYSPNEADFSDKSSYLMTMTNYDYRYSPDENVQVSFAVEPYIEIMDFSHQSIGFSIVESVIAGNMLEVELLCDDNQEECSIQLSVQLKNGTFIDSYVYAFNTEHGVFISPFSIDNARERYFKYALDEGIIAQEEFKEIWDDLNRVHTDPISSITDTSNLDLELNNVDSTVSTNDVAAGTITGKIRWEDDNGNDNHFLRGVKVEAYSKGVLIDNKIGTTYTNNSGEYTFNVPANSNVYFKIYAGDSNIMVKSAILLIDYYFIYDNEKLYINVASGESLTIPDIIITMGDDAGKALQISQAVITARDYAEEMIGYRPSNVAVVYPHDLVIEDVYNTDNKNGCYYQSLVKTIYITGRHPSSHLFPHSYAAWDVIMHEYGHHIQAELNICDNPGSGHFVDIDMSEHYKSHYVSQSFNVCTYNVNCAIRNDLNLPSLIIAEEKCKYYGCAISWAEAWATVFGNMAQEYYSDILSNIDYVCDASYTSYNEVDHSIRTGQIFSTEAVEVVNIALIYDLYDSLDDDIETYDNVSIDYETMWEYLVDQEVNTLYEFIERIKSREENKNILSSIGKLLNEYNLSTTAPELIEFSFESPTVEFQWDEPNSGGYYNKRKFRVNFYDSSYNLIVSTTPEVVEFDSVNHKGTIDISEEIWQLVIELDSSIYVSVTMAEYDGNLNNSGDNYYITEYESEYALYNISDLYEEIDYTSVITETLDVGDYYWYKFTAPMTEVFTFETTGSTDTYGELFLWLAEGTSTTYLLGSNDDGGDNNNFRIAISLDQGDTVYLRIRGYNWTRTGEYTLSVCALNHIHDYTHSYSKSTNLKHKAYCICGEYIFLPHRFSTSLVNQTCMDCGERASGSGPIIKDSIENETLACCNEVYYIPNKENE